MVTENTIIRHTRDLPAWFDIKKYKGLKHLTSAEWYDLLLQRHSHIRYIELNSAEFYQNRSLPIASALTKLRNDPLYISNDELEVFLFGGGQLDALKNDTNLFNEMSFGITPITLMQLYQIECWYKEEIKIRSRNWVDQILSGDFDLGENYTSGDEATFIKSFIHEPISNSLKSHGDLSSGETSIDISKRGSSFVRIDFSLPDKALIEQFKQYLIDYRQKFPNSFEEEQYKYPNFNKWIDFGILPFLDLKIWQLQTSNKIPNRVMADAIYPDGEKGEEMIRKTTQKITRTIMSYKYLNFFSTIVAQENRK
jgi:hypothetical protein